MRGAEADTMGLLLQERIIFLGSGIDDFVAHAVISQPLLLNAQDPTRDIRLFINSLDGSLSVQMAPPWHMVFNMDDALTVLATDFMAVYRSVLDVTHTPLEKELIKSMFTTSLFDLGRLHRLLCHLDEPLSDFKAVHIAGTKGKGLTATFLSNILQEEGYYVGCYTRCENIYIIG